MIELFYKGGPIMWPILCASVVALTVALERLAFAVSEAARRNRPQLSEVLSLVGQGDVSGARKTGAVTGDFVVRALVAQGKTVVSVLHEISFALHADQMVIMANGRVAHQGECADAATHRALQAVFDHRITIHALAGQWVAMPNAVASLQ